MAPVPRSRIRACCSFIGATVTVVLGLGAPRTALAEDTTPALDTEREELAGLPFVGGNSDIGVQFGVAGTLTSFHENKRPYFWNLDAVLSLSVKSDTNGTRLVQHSHILRLDLPERFGGRVRVDARAQFQRTINSGYFGLGNATTSGPVPGSTSIGRRYQYLRQEGRVANMLRFHTGTPVSIALGVEGVYEAPEVYAGSKLEEDAHSVVNGRRVALGTQSSVQGSLLGGIVIDTRDSEFVTRRGIYYQFALGPTAGASEGIAYGQAGTVLSHYAPLPGPFIFASRFVSSFQSGNVPFYDLQQGGAFEMMNLFGGEQGVRGVPQGRYAGRIKVVGNFEIRSTLPRFTLFNQRLRFGTTTFFDSGRTWRDYKYDPISDGRKLGLKYGIGGGIFLQWGEAAILRFEAAYSPDAGSANPGFPVGIYVAEGLMF